MTRKESQRKPKTHGFYKYAPADVQIPKKLGSGVLKELVLQEKDTGRVVKYALAYINPQIFAGDNGRVLGYGNDHGYPHKHFKGEVTPEPFVSWEALREKFEKEWQEIALRFINGENV